MQKSKNVTNVVNFYKSQKKIAKVEKCFTTLRILQNVAIVEDSWKSEKILRKSEIVTKVEKFGKRRKIWNKTKNIGKVQRRWKIKNILKKKINGPYEYVEEML